MNKKVFKSFNEQVQAEFYSAYMYLAMSLDMEAKIIKVWLNGCICNTKKNVNMHCVL